MEYIEYPLAVLFIIAFGAFFVVVGFISGGLLGALFGLVVAVVLNVIAYLFANSGII